MLGRKDHPNLLTCYSYQQLFYPCETRLWLFTAMGEIFVARCERILFIHVMHFKLSFLLKSFYNVEKN